MERRKRGLERHWIKWEENTKASLREQTSLEMDKTKDNEVATGRLPYYPEVLERVKI
jgi:hypothetical protein